MRLSGRAPKFSSYPSSANHNRASSVNFALRSCSCRRSWISFICKSTILVISSLVRVENMIISSMRLRNSGRNVDFNALSILSCDSRSSSLLSGCKNPSVPPFFINSVPRLLVMIKTVFRKSTTWPCPSVRRPSSKIWSSEFQISGWAFSISSNKITRYGRRRTASVSWPPSS